MKREKKKPKTIKISIIASLLLSITFIILILFFTVNPSDIRMLVQEKIRYEFFLGAVLLNVCFWFVWGARLMVLGNAIEEHVKIGLWESTKIVIANLFLAGITPSMAGGEPVRIHLLKKDGLSFGGATAAVLGERLLDAMFILVCAPLAFVVYRDLIVSDVLQTALLIGILVFIIAIVLFAYTIKNPQRVKTFLLFISEKMSRVTKKKQGYKKGVNRINREVDNFHDAMVFLLGREKKAFLLAGCLTVLLWSTGFMIPSMILLGLGQSPYVLESYAAQCLLIVVVMMPTTPGGAGVTELSMTGLYLILIGQSLIGVFVLLFRFISYHMNMIAGAIFQYRIFKSVFSFSLESIQKEK